jgi:hypothetical protein
MEENKKPKQSRFAILTKKEGKTKQIQSRIANTDVVLWLLLLLFFCHIILMATVEIISLLFRYINPL